MRNATFKSAGVSPLQLSSKRKIFRREVIKIKCLFRNLEDFQQPLLFTSSRAKDMDGNLLNQDLVYFADHAYRNYKHYVQARATNTQYILDVVYINEKEKNEHQSTASKSLKEIKRLIFGALEKLLLHAQRIYKDMYDKDVLHTCELHHYLDFYSTLLEVNEMFFQP